MPEPSSRNTALRTILAADIGGTHSRFALFTLDTAQPSILSGLVLVRKARLATGDIASSVSMMETLALLPGDDGGYFTPLSPQPERVDSAVLAIPGPTAVADPARPPRGNEAYLCPNMVWTIEAAPVSAGLKGAPVHLINDFVANGFACALLQHLTDAVPVLDGIPKEGFPRAVVGGGTGLGHCLILPGDPPAVLGSEAGHTLFPFTAGEAPLFRHFTEFFQTDRIVGDMVVTGSGLACLYAYCTGEKRRPRDVPALAANNPEVLALAAKLYGRAISHYVLNTLALGGVFVTGGLAGNLPGVLTHPAFAEELRNNKGMRGILEHVPVRHARNQDTGLWGAAACAALSLRN